MRTIRTKVYKFAELSEEAKENAINNIRDKQGEDGYFWGDDCIESLKGFAKHFNCELRGYSFDWDSAGRSRVTFEVPDYMEDMAKEDLKIGIESMGSYNPETLKGHGECKFTGYMADENAADGARIAFYKDGERDVLQLLIAGFNTWIQACVADYEHQQSDEAIIEDIEANDYEFYKDGTQY